eukprot:TRINITY_DN48992_c0_g1_i1.p1 TRINITY_DN48992_c0_g1~~TRINITY_DN48992_c0_g1_i1.p1  ORF type:complete len:541 (+),score=31.70 TRINITY_DN48992_c0_g1_i1:72-1694(+)
MLAALVAYSAVSAQICSEHILGGGSEVNYILCTELNGTEVVIELQAKTKGWVGLGIGEQSSGSMPGADIGVVEGEGGIPGVRDLHAVVKDEPLDDCLSGGWGFKTKVASGGWVNITLTKPIRSNDTSQDRDIPPGPTLIIMAMGDTAKLTYHGETRTMGTHTFYETATTAPDEPEYDLKIDLKVANLTVPTRQTTYACASFDLEPYIGNTRHHAVKISPAVRTGRGYGVHHLLVFACDEQTTSFSKYLTAATSCTIGFECRRYLIWGWALGGQDLILPSDVGLPYGPNTYNTKLIIEFHYDNPAGVEGAVDDSGVTIYLSKTLREHEAGFFNIGDPLVQHKSPIPPLRETLVKFDCGSSCTSKFTGNVTVIGTWLHMHRTGLRGALQLIRDGVFTENLATVDYWNNDLQRFVPAADGATIKPNDVLRTICDYYHEHTTDVAFGPATTDEMCMAFILMYPFTHSPGTVCGSIGSTTASQYLCGSSFVPGMTLVLDGTRLPPRWGDCDATPGPLPPTPEPGVKPIPSSLAMILCWVIFGLVF